MNHKLGKCQYTPCEEDATQILNPGGVLFRVCDECAETTKAFMELDKLLKDRFLPCRDENDDIVDTRIASATEFMYMGTQDGTIGFKHSGTRSYVYIKNHKLIEAPLGDYTEC